MSALKITNASLVVTIALVLAGEAFAVGGVPASMTQGGKLTSEDWNFVITTPTEGKWAWLTDSNGSSRGKSYVARQRNSRTEFVVVATKYRPKSMDVKGVQGFLTDLKVFKDLDSFAWEEVQPGWSYAFTDTVVRGRVFLTERAAYLVFAKRISPEIDPVFQSFADSFQLFKKPTALTLGWKIGIGAIGLLVVLFGVMRFMSS